jgi:hypothetical protein
MPVDSPEIKKIWSGLFLGTPEPELSLPLCVKVNSLRRLILISIRGALSGRKVLLDIDHLHVFTDYFPNTIEKVRDANILIYANPAGITDLVSTGLPFAAVHVRRGSAWEFASFGLNRVTSNSEVLRRIMVLVESKGPMTGIVYSALPDSELAALLPEGFELNSTADEFEVIHRMINSDFTILAKSSMSYVAGVFAKGEVLYEPFWHPALSNWSSN